MRGGAQPSECRLAAEQLDALEQPGRHRRARDRDADRLESLARLQAEPLDDAAERRLDRLGRERLQLGERVARGATTSASPSTLLDVLEEKARVVGELVEPRDLLLHERRRLAHELCVPVVAVLAEPQDEPVRELVRR